ncbi:MAG: oligosaccharide flippase family protein [Flavitalea sp.]
MSVFKKYGYWINSGKFTAIQKLSTLLMGIASFSLLARVLGPDSFGVWGLFLTISAILETARTALVRNAYIRFVNQVETEHEKTGLQAAAFMMSFFVSLVLAAIFLLLGDWVSGLLKAPLLRILLYWYCVTILISCVFSHFEIILNARLNFAAICWMYCIRQAFLVGALLLLFLTDTKITNNALGILYLVSVIVGSAVGYYFVRSFVVFFRSDYAPWSKKLWRYGRFVFANNISSLLFRSTDSFATSNYFGPGISGYYNASLRISNLVDMPSQVIGDILFPKAAKYNADDKKTIANIYEKTVGATLIFSIPALLVLLIFPAQILYLLAGDKFVEAAPILRITAFFGFILPFLKQFGTIMDATGHPDLNFRVMFTAFCINIVNNIAGMYFFGIIGAALGTAFTYLIILTISQILLHRMFGVKFLRVFTNTFSLYLEVFATAKGMLAGKRKGVRV